MVRNPLSQRHAAARALRQFTFATASLLISISVAQAEPRAADPLNVQASVPPLVHESAFAQYRRLGEVSVGSWRDANDTVSRIGGWRAYAREARQPDSSSSSPSSAPPPAAPAASAPISKPPEPVKAMPQGHDGHKMN